VAGVSREAEATSQLNSEGPYKKQGKKIRKSTPMLYSTSLYADEGKRQEEVQKMQKHTTAGIRWWSPTQLLICRSEACV
jgi:hypothetical protein